MIKNNPIKINIENDIDAMIPQNTQSYNKQASFYMYIYILFVISPFRGWSDVLYSAFQYKAVGVLSYKISISSIIIGMRSSRLRLEISLIHSEYLL